ncbi:MAG: response regulator [Pseudomonadales bacterium]|nr:response regulator [Pseudomonadales bacterium]
MELQSVLAVLAVMLIGAVLVGLIRLNKRLGQLQGSDETPPERRQKVVSVSERGEESFWKWFRTSTVACVVVRRQVLIRLNPSAEELLGRPESELVDRPATTFMTRASAAYAQEVGIEPALAAREYEVVKPSGEIMVIVTQPSMMTLGGEDTRVLMLFDVTERKQREQTLRYSEQNLEVELSQKVASLDEAQRYLGLALEHFSEGYILVDDAQSIRFLNRRMRAIFPDAAHSMKQGADWLSVVDTILASENIVIDLADSEAAIRSWFQSGATAGLVHRDLQFKGNRWARITIKSLPSGDQIITVVDISELKVLIEKAEIAAASKSNFLASMSHEIRTPMNGILGMVDLMKRSPLNDDQSEMVKTIQDSGKALLSLINDILDISKIEAGKMDLELASADLAEVAEAALEVIAINAAKNQQSLILNFDPNIPNNLMLDGMRLRQILVNLVGNAIKFSPLNAEIIVRIEQVGVASEDQCVLRLSVIDQGIGLSPEAKENIFADFAQAEKSTSRIYGGTGLGLAICRRLVEVMGGSIFVESTLGEGATFSLDLTFESSESGVAGRDQLDLADIDVLFIGPSEEAFGAIARSLEFSGAVCHQVGDARQLQVMLGQCAAGSAKVVIVSESYARSEQESIWRQEEAVQGQRPLGWVFLSTNRGQRLRTIDDRLALISSSPFRWRELMSAVSLMAGREGFAEVGDERSELQEAWVPMTAAEAADAGFLILVAEDNVINQQVIRRQLNTLGLACELAADGVEALDRIRRGGIGLLLTDCDMPNMDGYELTRRIRQEEQGRAGLPIIAITANAMEGAAEACFEAGMNDYLSKPLEIRALQTMLKSHLPSPQVSEVNDTSVQPEGDGPPLSSAVLDLTEMNALFGDDPELLNPLLDEFAESASVTVSEIQAASRDTNFDAVLSGAHKLKSSARTIGAHQLADLCLALERAGKERDLASVQAHVDQLESTFTAVIEAVNQQTKT